MSRLFSEYHIGCVSSGLCASSSFFEVWIPMKILFHYQFNDAHIEHGDSQTPIYIHILYLYRFIGELDSESNAGTLSSMPEIQLVCPRILKSCLFLPLIVWYILQYIYRISHMITWFTHNFIELDGRWWETSMVPSESKLTEQHTNDRWSAFFEELHFSFKMKELVSIL